MTDEEEMRSLARGAIIALLAVIGALVLHLRAGDDPHRALAMKGAKKPAPQAAAEFPEP